MDYAGIGFKAGLEVHQQLDTGKLFCRCQPVLLNNEPDSTIKRYLRPTASEMGEFDPAALEQYQKGHHYCYESFNDFSCEIELDEAPPKEADKEALKTVIEIALITNSKILEKNFVMRKLVIDGSNTSGFQRTVLISMGGKIKLKYKALGIQTIVLEEDSARFNRQDKNEVVYRTDRLGIPLIELATEPELFTPEEVKEAALAIGNIFRRTGKAKRGLGTIRQDLNVSIRGGTRVEIKGTQNLLEIDEFAKREAQRQLNLLEIKEELKKRGAKESDLNETPVDVTTVFENTECKFIKNAKESTVLAVKLKKFEGILGKELQQNRRFGTELADYVKARAGTSGLIHSDELPAYGITKNEVLTVQKELSIQPNDGFALVVAPKEKALKAIEVILQRCITALKEVPAETRNALEGGNTSYSRPLAGAERMYPETDLAPIKISKKEIAQIKKDLPLSAKQRLELYTKEFGLSTALANKMKLNNFARFFEKLVKQGHDPTKTAVILLEGLKQVKRMGADTSNLSNEMLEEFLLKIKNKEIRKEVHVEMLFAWAKNPQKPLDEILKEKNMVLASKNEVQTIVKEIINKNQKTIQEKKEHALSALMGEAMQQLKGKASGKEISEVLRRQLKDALK